LAKAEALGEGGSPLAKEDTDPEKKRQFQERIIPTKETKNEDIQGCQ
jgi:hypothetical protein